MRKTILRKTTITLAVFFALSAVLFAASRYYSEASRSLRVQQEITDGHHDENE